MFNMGQERDVATYKPNTISIPEPKYNIKLNRLISGWNEKSYYITTSRYRLHIDYKELEEREVTMSGN